MSTLSFPTMEDDNSRSRRSSSTGNTNQSRTQQLIPVLKRHNSNPAAATNTVAKRSITQHQPPPSPCPFSPCQFSVEIEHSFSCDNLQLSMKAPCTSSQSPNKPWSLAMKPSTTATTTTSSYEHHDHQQQTSPHLNTGVEFPLHHDDTQKHHKVTTHHRFVPVSDGESDRSSNQQRDRDQDREDAENYASSEEDMVSRMRPTMGAAGPGVQLQLQYDDQHSPSSNTSHNSRLSPRVGPRIEQLDLGGDSVSGGGAITPLPYNNNARLSPRIAPRIDDDQFGSSSSAITPLPNRLSPGRMNTGDQQVGEMTPNLLNPFISLTPGVPQNHHPPGGAGHHQQHQQPPHPMYQQKPCHRRNNSLTLIISTPQRKHRRQISIDVANQHAHQQHQLQLQQTTSNMNNNNNNNNNTATTLMTHNNDQPYDENAFAVHLGSPPPPSGDMNCMYDCFGITDFTHLFCPQTPIISSIEQTNTGTAADPYACDLLTCEDVSRGLEYFPSAIQEYQSSTCTPSQYQNGELGLVGLQEFWANTVSPDNSPIRRNRNDLLYDETNHLPKNRSHKQRRRHVQQLMEVWYAHDTTTDHNTDTEGVTTMGRKEEENNRREKQKKKVAVGRNELNQSHDDFGLDLNDMLLNRVPYHPYQNDYNSRRRVSQHERSCLAFRDPRQQRCCYDSDPEQEYRGRQERRRAVMLSAAEVHTTSTSTTPASMPRRTEQTTTANQPPTTKQVLPRNGDDDDDDDDDDDLEQVAAAAYGLEEHLKQLERDRTKVEEELQQRLEALDLVDDPDQQEQEQEQEGQQQQPQQDRAASSKKVVQHQPRFRNFRPAPFTHLDTDEETEDDSSQDDEKEKVEQQQHEVSTSSVTSTSDGYQTAEDGEHENESSSLDRYSEPCGGGSSCQIPIHPPTPRESVADKISFGFCGFSKTFSIDNTTSSDVIVVGGGGQTVPTTTAETNNKMTTTTTTATINNTTTSGNDISAPNHRNLSMTSLSSIATEKGCNTSGHHRNVSLSSDVIPITGGEGENSQRRRQQHRRNVSMSSINSSTSASHNKTRQRNNKKKGGGHHRRNSSLTSISSLSQRRTQHHRRRSSTEMSFDFGKAVAAGNDGEGDDEDGSLRRNISTTSLSTTGHSRFHTIRMSRDDLDESDNSSQNASTATTSSSSSIVTTTTTTTTGEGIGIGGDSDDNDYCCGAGTTQTSSTVIPSYMKSQSTQWTEFHLLFSKDADEELIKSHVHELSNIRFPLVWHPPPAALSANADTNNTSNSGSNNNTKNKSSSSHSVSTSSAVVNSTSRKIASLFSDVSTPPPTTPTGPSTTNDSNNNNNSKSATTTTTTCTPTPIAVYASFEVGAHLEHLVVQPKFTWTPVVQPHLTNHNAYDSNNNRLNRRELLLSESAPPQIELLSIIRVNKPPRLDRTIYPFARLDRVCCITTNDPNYPNLVLECPSEQERDWLVFSMKLIVARLASIIITRDEEMLHEFFSPYSALMQLDGDDADESEESGVVARVGVVVDPNDKSESSDGRSHYEEVGIEATTGDGGDRYAVVVTTNNNNSSSDNNKRGREEVSTPPRSSFTAAATSAISSAREAEATRVVIVDDHNDEEVDYVFTDCKSKNKSVVAVHQENKYDVDNTIAAIVEEAGEEVIDSTDEDEEIVTEESDDIKDAAAAAVIIGGGVAERDRYEYVSCHQYHDRAARRAHPSSPPPPHGVGSSSPSSSQRSMSKTESPLRSCATTATTTTPAAAATGGGVTTTTTGVKPSPHADGMIRTFSF